MILLYLIITTIIGVVCAMVVGVNSERDKGIGLWFLKMYSAFFLSVPYLVAVSYTFPSMLRNSGMVNSLTTNEMFIVVIMISTGFGVITQNHIIKSIIKYKIWL